MANQWGRDANVATSGSRSSFGLVILFFLALFVGLAGGYAGFRFLSGVSTTELDQRDQQIAELEKTITDLRFNNDGAKNEQGALEKEIDLLRVRLGKANDTIEALRTDAGKANDAELKALQDELEQTQNDNEVLRRELENGDELSVALDKAKKSLRVSEGQILDLEREVTASRSQIDSLKQQLASQSAGLDQTARAQIKALTDDNIRLAAELATQGKEARQLKSALEDKIAELTAAADKSSQDLAKANKALEQQTGLLAAAAAERDKLAKDVTRQKTLNKDLEKRLTDALSELANGQDSSAAVTRLTAERDALQASLDTATASLKDVKAKLKSASADNVALQAEIGDLTARVETLTKQLAQIGNPDTPIKPGDDIKDPNPDPTPDTLKPRSASAVDRALSRMPSLDRLSDDQQAELRARLEDGACVTDSLEAVFDRVPVLALRNLIRDLKSPC